MFFHEKCRMEMKCQRYDITDVDVLNIFYIQKLLWKIKDLQQIVAVR
jgi:hypothetical protein